MLDRSVPTEVTTAFQTFLDTHFTKNPEIIAVWAKNFEQHLPLELITDDPQIYFRVLFSNITIRIFTPCLSKTLPLPLKKCATRF